MVSYYELKQLIDQYIKQNGQQSITGKSLNNVLTEIVSGVFDRVDSYLDIGNTDQMLDDNLNHFLNQSSNKVGRFSIRTTDGVLYRGVYFGGYTSGGTEKHIVGIDEFGCFVDLRTSDFGFTWTSAIVNEYDKIPLKSVLAAIEQNFTEEEKEVMCTNLGVNVLLDELREDVQTNSQSIERLQGVTDTIYGRLDSQETRTNQRFDSVETELESNAELIEDLQNTKIDKEADDYYPQLSVGTADNLAGQEDATPSEFNYRQSGGGAILDGTARIESIKGNSLVWNQYVEESNATKQVTSVGYFELFEHFTSVKEHKYFISFVDVNECSDRCRLVGFDANGYYTESDEPYSGKYFSVIKKLSPYRNERIIVRPFAKDGITEGVFQNIQFIDLTQMFGVGNEPTTIHEFYARIPQNIDEYAYNEGEVIHSNVDAIESVGFNLWDEQWRGGIYSTDNGKFISDSSRFCSKNPINCLPNREYKVSTGTNDTIWMLFYDSEMNYLGYAMGNNGYTSPNRAAFMHFYMVSNYGNTYKNDICINLSNSAKNGTYEPYISREQRLDIIKKYFPNGMRSAGTAHDEIRWNKQTQKWEKVQRIGEVNLGDLTWENNTTYGGFSSKSITTAKIAYNGVCAKYPFVGLYTKVQDKEMGYIYNTCIIVKDSTYTDAASFKSAMQGVMLYFELAEPIVTEIDEDINLDYEVWNGGTEKAIATEPTTPFKADIVYGFNAYGVIKDLRTQIATLQTMLSQMQLAMASMTNNEEL